MRSSQDKSPLTARLDSSGSDEMPDRNTPSPISVLATQLNGSLPYNHDTSDNHHYASPQELQEEIELERLGRHKKRNLIYEETGSKGNEKLKSNGFVPPELPARRRNSSDIEIESLYNRKKNKKVRLFTCLVLAVFLVSLGAVSLAVYSFLERSNSKKSESRGASSSKIKGDENDVIINSNTFNSEEQVLWLKQNFTHLHDHVIPDLVAKIDALTKKLEEKAVTGPPGPAGPQGPPGAGDMSKCEYKTLATRNIENAVTQSTYITEDDKYKILGVACSQEGAAFASLSTTRNSKSQRQYYCTCVGPATSNLWKSSDGYIQCRIHYWRCPTLTTTS